MKTAIEIYIDDNKDEMHAIALEDTWQRKELCIFDEYHRIEFEGAHYMIISKDAYVAEISGPFATIEEAEILAQKCFYNACEISRQIKTEKEYMINEYYKLHRQQC